MEYISSKVNHRGTVKFEFPQLRHRHYGTVKFKFPQLWHYEIEFPLLWHRESVWVIYNIMREMGMKRRSKLNDNLRKNYFRNIFF